MGKENQDYTTGERPIGEVLAKEPLSVFLVLRHEIGNMMDAVRLASENSTQFEELVEADQSLSPIQRKAFFEDLEISPAGHLIIGEFLEQTGGFDEPIVQRMMAAIPSYFKQRVSPLLKLHNVGQATFEEVRDAIFTGSLTAGLEFFDLIEALGMTKDKKTSLYLQEWQERHRAQSTLAVAQIAQWLLDRPLSPQFELMEMREDDVLKLLEEAVQILESDLDRELPENGL